MSCLATEPAGSPEALQRESDPSPETHSSESLTQSIKVEMHHHPESPSPSGPSETSSLPEEVSNSSMEEKKTITPATKDLKSTSEPSDEEPMEVSLSKVTEPSVENKASFVPKVENEDGVNLVVDKASKRLMMEEHEKLSEGLTAKEDAERSTDPLALQERDRVTEDPAVQEHQRSSEVELLVKKNTFEGIPAEEHTSLKSSERLLIEQCERITEECKTSSEGLSVEECEGALDSVDIKVSSEGLPVEECESHAAGESEKGLTVGENCGRTLCQFMAEENKRSFEGLTEAMDFSMDGERSLAKLSSLVEERTSLKPSAVRQPESFHCSVINSQILSAPGEPSSNVPSATFIPLTPKIGMGKPAISKRKFSPGRPRVKQVGPLVKREPHI